MREKFNRVCIRNVLGQREGKFHFNSFCAMATYICVYIYICTHIAKIAPAPRQLVRFCNQTRTPYVCDTRRDTPRISVYVRIQFLHFDLKLISLVRMPRSRRRLLRGRARSICDSFSKVRLAPKLTRNICMRDSRFIHLHIFLYIFLKLHISKYSLENKSFARVLYLFTNLLGII